MKAAVAHIPRREGALWGRLLSKDVPLHREKGTDTHGCQPKGGGGCGEGRKQNVMNSCRVLSFVELETVCP